MNEKLKLNLSLAIFYTFFMVLMYFLLGKSMAYPLKVAYAVLTFALIIRIGFYIIKIKKFNDKEANK